MSVGSKKVNYIAIGLGAIVGVALPAAGQSIVPFCIKVIVLALVTGLGISWQAWLDHKGQNSPANEG